MIVSIVTNASLLSSKKLLELRPWVDWIGVSIDSRKGRGRGDPWKGSWEALGERNRRLQCDKKRGNQAKGQYSRNKTEFR